MNIDDFRGSPAIELMHCRKCGQEIWIYVGTTAICDGCAKK